MLFHWKPLINSLTYKYLPHIPVPGPAESDTWSQRLETKHLASSLAQDQWPVARQPPLPHASHQAQAATDHPLLVLFTKSDKTQSTHKLFSQGNN